MTENKMAELEISQTKCVCGKELSHRRLVAHKGSCFVYHKWLDDHQQEIVEFSLVHSEQATKRRFRIGSRIFHGLRIQTGIEKWTDFSRYTKKSTEASLRHHRMVMKGGKPLAVVMKGNKPLAVVMDSVTPPKEKMDLRVFLDEMNQGTFWRGFAKSGQVGELMAEMMLYFLSERAEDKRKIKDYESERAEDKRNIKAYESEIKALRESRDNALDSIKLFTHQRDKALVQAAKNAFCEPGEP